MKTLGEIIKSFRSQNNLSLRDFGDKCGISHSYIDRLEKGIDPRNGKPVIPTLDTIERISKAMGKTTEEILSEIGFIYNNDNKNNDRKPVNSDMVSDALKYDPELVGFWNEMQEREDLKVLFKKSKRLKPDDVKQIIRMIKLIEDEEDGLDR